MEISDLVAQLRLPPTAGQPRQPLEMRVGQILQALVKGTVAEGLFRLQIGQNEVLAQSRVPLQPGRSLALEVEKAGTTPMLRVIEAVTPEALKAEALKLALPRMLALGPALGRLLEIAEANQAPQLPPEVRKLVRQLIDLLPNPREATTPDGLRRAVGGSGLFNEAGLVHDGQPAGDLKTALQRLAVRLRSGAGPSAQRPATASVAQKGAAQSTPATQTTAPRPGISGSGTASPPAQSGGTAVQTPSTPAPAPGAPARTPQSPPGPAAASGRAAATESVPQGRPVVATPPAADQPKQETAGSAQKIPPGSPSRAMVEAAAAQLRQPGNAPAPARPATVPPPTPGGAASAPPAARPAAGETLPPLPETLSRPSPRPEAGTKARPLPPAADATARLGQELARQVEGAVARIQYNQLSSLPQEDPSRQAWQLDLPLRDGERLDAFQLRIEKEAKRKNGAAVEGWTVTLTFDLAPLGPVHTRIGLQGETVSGTFWAERPETAGLINRRLGELRGGFERAGLEVGSLSAHRGPAPRTVQRPASGSLLDDSA